LIPSALREFSECFPAYTLHIAPGDGPEVIDSLKRDQIDLGVVVKLDRGPRLAHHPLFTDELGFLVSSLHPWARTGRVNIEELRDQPLIVYSRSSATFRLIERYFLRMRVELLDPIELGSMEAIKELIKLGLSVGIVSSWIAAAEIEAGSLVWLKLPGTPIRRNWTLAAIAGRRLSLAEQTFVGLCQSVAAELVPRIENRKSRLRS
jgi:DNA-binding transcriptional LysR family regulator